MLKNLFWRVIKGVAAVPQHFYIYILRLADYLYNMTTVEILRQANGYICDKLQISESWNYRVMTHS